ncbi:MAG: DUF4445 domain-containing protein [Deltaproteobacteria bacterium]|nr:DUF4445 domain-containing protein [Deltaproteobacteria bacterium]MBW2070047.1 DUF4445 domain-containing protein [Deltaproteobacteria bacterium]
MRKTEKKSLQTADMPEEILAEVRLTFDPPGISRTVPVGKSIIEAADGLDIPIRSDCGGKGLCAKCWVVAEPAANLSPLTEPELDVFTPAEIKQSYRLACQAKVAGNVNIRIPKHALAGAESGDKVLATDRFPVNPMVKRIALPKERLPRDAAGSDLVSWVIDRAGSLTERPIHIEDLEALRQLSEAGADGEPITLVHHEQRGVTAVIAGKREQSLGAAIDVGTTTLAAYLCDLTTGKLLARAASLNPQRQYGEDVISRIAYADEHTHGLQVLNALLIDAVNHLVGRCLSKINASREDVDEVTIVGNPTMERILMGLHPRGLGMSPYFPVIRAGQNLKARDLGLEMNPGTNVYVFPVISGFVGGDTVGAILADAIYQRGETCLLVDIGTNGEIVLGNCQQLWATSCATGPALEGAQISCGMRAVPGAIYQVAIDPRSLQPQYRVIGEEHNILPAGLCGSGVIDAIAAMLRSGILLPNGRLEQGAPGVVTDSQGQASEFILVPADKSATGKPISIKQSDVRQFQLAKSALSVGIELLMKHAKVDRVQRTVLTGSFGARFDWKNALDIGMLPRKAFGGQVLSLENLAGVGAVLALLDKSNRELAATLVQKIHTVDLAMDPEFATRFSEGTLFPAHEST